MNELVAAVKRAKKASADAQIANAQAADAGLPPVYSSADMDELRLAVDLAAMEARQAGCDLTGIVGPHVGNIEDP